MPTKVTPEASNLIGVDRTVVGDEIPVDFIEEFFVFSAVFNLGSLLKLLFYNSKFDERVKSLWKL